MITHLVAKVLIGAMITLGIVYVCLLLSMVIVYLYAPFRK